MLAAEKREPAELRRDVTSPGGTTQAALRILAGPKGLSSLIARAVRAAAQRAQELTE
jgi:pyrroline-5-carboxylate reductase